MILYVHGIKYRPSGARPGGFFEKNAMAIKTEIFTFLESDLKEARLPIAAAIRSARGYVGIDQQVYVDLFCSYEYPLKGGEKVHNLCAAVDGTQIPGDFVAYVCPLFLPDGGIGGLFAII